MRWTIVLLLCACEPRSAAALREAKVNTDGLDCSGSACLDAVSGCQYLRMGESLTPRLNADGRPMCGTR